MQGGGAGTIPSLYPWVPHSTLYSSHPAHPGYTSLLPCRTGCQRSTGRCSATTSWALVLGLSLGEATLAPLASGFLFTFDGLSA